MSKTLYVHRQFEKASVVLLAVLLVGLLGVRTAGAALLEVAPGLPLLNYDNTGTVSYNAGTNAFSVNAQPISILFPPPRFVSDSTNAGPKTVQLNIAVDDAGNLVGGVPGDDLVIVGAVDTTGDNILDADGVLLTGEVTAFGFEDSGGPTDFYDFRFIVTGGLLAPSYAGQDIGVTLTSEGSTFTGNFNVNFGGAAKGNVGPIPPEPDIEIEKFTNGHDGDDANGTPTATPPNGPFTPGDPRVAQVAVGGGVVWTYRVTNTGGEDLVNVVVTDPTGTAQGAVILCPNTGDNTILLLEVGESVDCTASLPGGARALDLEDPDVVPGCGDGRPTYENTGEVVGFGETSNTEVSDEDPSHYCNPLEPAIELEKFTNGHDGDGANGTPSTTPPVGPFTPGANEVAQVAVSVPVVWTYRVRNTGDENLINIEVTDLDAAAQGATISCPDGGNTIASLAIGATVDCTATLPGGAADLDIDNVPTVPGCGDDRPTYENTGAVVGEGETSGEPVDDMDDSHYCNPLEPEIELEKFTNGHDGDNADGDPTATPPDGPFTPDADVVAQVAVGGPVVWTYRVRNTGMENLVNITVTDPDAAAQGAPLECDTSGNNTIAFLAIGATEDCTATLPGGAADLDIANVPTVPGCGDDRPTYENTGEVVGEGETSGEPVDDMDDSHYCNPLVPDIELEKFTNGHDGDNANGTPEATPPDGPFTPGADEVAEVAEIDPVAWTYRVRNTGTENLVNVVVTDAEATNQGAAIVCPGVGNFNTIPFLAIGDTVDCIASLPGGARDLILTDPDVVPGCGDGRPTYMNTGDVVGEGETSGDPVDDMDDSHYCNPPPEPEIEIQKTTDGAPNGNPIDSDFDNEDLPNGPGVPVLTPGDTVTWTYKVTNPGVVSFAEADVTVTDSVAGVNPVRVLPDFVGNDDNLLEPGEMWRYEASGVVLDLEALPLGDPIVNGCNNVPVGSGSRNTYQNLGTVTVPGDTDSDPSHYCNPEPSIAIQKTTDGAPNYNPVDSDFDNEDDPNGVGVPVLTPGTTVTWTYKVTNTGVVSIPELDVTVTDSVAGVNPVRVTPDFMGNDDDLLEPDEMWRYEATGAVLDLETLPLADPIVTGCNNVPVGTGPRNTYQNIATVMVPGDDDSDPSHYCNLPLASLGDYVWNDLDADGVQNDGETGINGVTVRLLSCAGVELDTTATGAGGPNDQSADPNGFYEFTGLVPGCYKVMFDTPAGFVVSPRQQGGNPALDSDGLMSDDVNLAPGERNATLDSGFYEPAALGDYVWNDLDADGVQNDGETGINGVTVRLLSCAGVELGTTVTGAGGPNDQSADPNGFYEFTGLVPGCYKVMFDTPAGFMVSPRQQGGNPALDSDGLMSDEVNLASGERNATLDSGFYEPASLGDYVWNDLDADGVQNDGETGINGVTVRLLSCAGVELDTTATSAGGPNDQSADPNGFYEFTGLVPGCYKVMFDTPAGFVVSPRQQGGNPALDSDGLMSDEVNLASGERNATLDSGFVQEVCEISVSKTCVIPEPPVNTLAGKCNGKIQEWTVIWPMGQPQITLSGLPNDAPGGIVNPGQEVTFFNPGGGANDVFVDISGGANGESKFHLSCSDKDMNADNDNDVQQQLPGRSQDCGKFAGNAKSSSGFINDWIFEGLVDADGLELDCTAAPDFPTEEVQCEFTPQPPDTGLQCSDIKDITELTMVWDGPDGVTVTPSTGVTGVSPATVNNGDVMTIDVANNAPNDIFINLTGGASGQSKFHISCSDKDMNANDDNQDQQQVPGMSRDCGKFQGNAKSTSGFVNEWLYAGMAGEGGVISCPDMPGGAGTSTEVIYGITVENPNDEAIDVTIVDDQLGIKQMETIAANGTFELVTDPVNITPDGTGTDPFDPDVFKNTVVVTGTTVISGAMCEAMDMVRVKRNPPPPEPPLLGKCSGKLQEVVVYWNGTGSVNLTPGNGVASLSASQVDPGDVLTVFTDGSTNDVFVNISGSVSGESKFHVSCSDKDMNADNDDQDQQQLLGETQDCGKFQGNAKSTSGFINDWLLEGMLDKDGLRLTCDFDPTSVVPQSNSSGGGPGGGDVSGAASLDLGDNKKAKWELTNDGDEDVFVTRVLVTWPFEHDQLKKIKLEGDFIKDMFDSSSPTDVPDEQAFESDAKKRKLKKNSSKKLEIEFTEGFKDHTEADYTIQVEFDNGQLLTFP